MPASPTPKMQGFPAQESMFLRARLQNALSASIKNGRLQLCLNHVLGDHVKSAASAGPVAAKAEESEETPMDVENGEYDVQQETRKDMESGEEDVQQASEYALKNNPLVSCTSGEAADEDEEQKKVCHDVLMKEPITASLMKRPACLMERPAAAGEDEENDEPEAKRMCLPADAFLDTMKVNVLDLGGKEFHVDINRGDRVVDIKGKILKEQDYQFRLQELRLILGSEVLDDEVDLSDTIKDGEQLTLIKHVGVMQLLCTIHDDTQWHGRHKFALRSDPLMREVEKIEVTVRNFRDQGWGGCQARLFIYLYDPAAKKDVASMKIFGPLRTSQYDERKHKRSPSCTIGKEEAVVTMAQPGMVYKLKYQCGGGGGHSITVTDWCCKVFPQRRSTDEVTIQVNGTVNLNNKSRLGPDRTTGKWELEEPPYQ